MRVNKKQVEKWVRALRSGKYKQTDSALQDSVVLIQFCYPRIESLRIEQPLRTKIKYLLTMESFEPTFG